MKGFKIMDNLVKEILFYIMTSICGIIAYIITKKADKKELEKLERKVEDLQTHIYTKVATKEDLNKLSNKIDDLYNLLIKKRK
jgi:hypothetical protein